MAVGTGSVANVDHESSMKFSVGFVYGRDRCWVSRQTMTRPGGSYRARKLGCNTSRHRCAEIQHQRVGCRPHCSDGDMRVMAMIDHPPLGSVLLTYDEWSCQVELVVFSCPGRMEPC